MTIYVGNKNRIHKLRAIGSGMGRGIWWTKTATFEAGALTPNPTGFDATGGAGAGDLSVDPAAAIRGNFGFLVDIVNINPRYGILSLDNFTQIETEYLFDVNSITMADSDVFDSVRLTGASIAVFVQLQYTIANGYELRYIARNDAAGNIIGAFGSLPDEASKIRIQWKASDSPGANNGICRLFINNNLVDEDENIDNDTLNLTFANIGAVGGLDAGTTGQIFYDNIYMANKLRG